MLLSLLVFTAVFVVAALLLTASGTGASQRTKQTMSRLDAILATEGTGGVKDELIDIRKQELLSSVPLLNRLLLQLEIAPKLRRLLYQANVSLTPGGVLLISLTCWVVAGYLLYLRTGVLWLAAMVGLIAATAPFGYLLFMRNKRFNQFEEGLPSALDMMVSALRSGQSLVSAIGLVGREVPDPIGREFRICYDEQNYGLELRTAMSNLAVRIPIQDIRIIITAILIQKETGGNLAEVLDKCAYVIRERFRLKREIRVKTAQGRLTGLILSLLPVILGFLLYLVNPKNMSLLWTHPMGVKMLYTSAVMTIVGALIIRKIMRIRI
jgi:tight adherence protein B